MSGTQTIGSVKEIVQRLRAVLPPSWFPITAPNATISATPVLDGLLTGISSAFSSSYALVVYAARQARLSTASGAFLDMISADFFGTELSRGAAELDDAFRSRIQANLLLPRGTRAAVSGAVDMLVGQAPTLVETSRAADLGGYAAAAAPAGSGGGGYGSPLLRFGQKDGAFQFLVGVAAASWSRRPTQATFIGSDGFMQVAGPYVLRSNGSGSADDTSLVEARGFNLIKDSLGWSGLNAAAPSASMTWSVDASGTGALLPGAATVKMLVLNSGSWTGPSLSCLVPSGAVTASAWVFVPTSHGLESCNLTVAAGNLVQSATVDLTRVEQWQRVSVSLAGLPSASLVMGFGGIAAGAATASVLTQCWQIEPGQSASSYIPSNGTLGFREADDVVSGTATAGSLPATSALLEAVRRAAPAGTVPWVAQIA